VLNFIIQSLIQPRFIGDSVGLAMTTTFVALVFWAWLLGPIGALLAIPLTLLVKALLEIPPVPGHTVIPRLAMVAINGNEYVFVRTDPKQLHAAASDTILGVLDAPMGSAVPLTLTAWDLSFLKALYASNKNSYAEYQRSEMQALMRRELDKAQTAGN